MLTKARDFFTKNIAWKILSLCIAIVLWFAVININNPTTTVSFTQSLSIVGEEVLEANDYILMNEDTLKSKYISFKIRGARSHIEELNRSKNDFKAYIDLAPIDISQSKQLDTAKVVNVEYKFPVYLDKNNYEVKSYTPSKVEIELDKYVKKTFPIKVKVIGEPKKQYVAYSPSVIPENVEISSGQKILDTIAMVEAQVNIDGQNKDIIFDVVPLKVYNYSEIDITKSVDIKIPGVFVKVPISKYGKIIINPPKTTGKPADGYIIKSIDYTPKNVEVIGSQENIEKMQNRGGIELPTTDVDGWTKTTNRTYDLQPYFYNRNLTIKNGTPLQVVVTVNIDKEETKELIIPIKDIAIIGMTNPSTIIDESVTVTVKGSSYILENLQPHDIKGSIDLTGLDTGDYQVQVKFNLPEGVVQVGKIPYLDVTIKEGTASPAPTAAKGGEAATPSVSAYPPLDTRSLPKPSTAQTPPQTPS